MAAPFKNENAIKHGFFGWYTRTLVFGSVSSRISVLVLASLLVDWIPDSQEDYQAALRTCERVARPYGPEAVKRLQGLAGTKAAIYKQADYGAFVLFFQSIPRVIRRRGDGRHTSSKG